jgi:hypothetical protein
LLEFLVRFSKDGVELSPRIGLQGYRNVFRAFIGKQRDGAIAASANPCGPATQPEQPTRSAGAWARCSVSGITQFKRLDLLLPFDAQKSAPPD